MPVPEDERLALLRRKEALGNRASYREIGRRIGRSSTTVRAVLLGGSRGMTTDRGRVIYLIRCALWEIETNSNPPKKPRQP